jgi:hypothetical protein
MRPTVFVLLLTVAALAVAVVVWRLVFVAVPVFVPVQLPTV